MLAQALDYGLVKLTIYARTQIGMRYALVRTKNGAAEEPSSGVTVESGVVSSPEFEVLDGRDNLSDAELINNVAVPVGPVYYTFFVFDASGNWSKDAATYTVAPRDRGSARMMLGMLPRVFTTKGQSPSDYPDETGDLFRFLRGFAVTLDEVQTYIDRVLPAAARSRATIAGLHDAHCRSVGMPVEYILGLGSTARLFRDAGLIYQNKGTESGVRYFAEALTGWSVEVRESPNRMLSLDDSSFETGVGSWLCTGGDLLRVPTGAGVDAPESVHDVLLDPFAAEGLGRIVLTSTTARLDVDSSPPDGVEEPTSGRATHRRLRGIPVTAGQTLYVSAYVRSGATISFTPVVTWMDEQGVNVGAEVRGTSETVVNAWERVNRSFVAPATARFVLLAFELSGAAGTTAYLDRIQVADTDTHFQDAQSVDVLCHPARVNLLTRPAFGGAELWDAATGSIVLDNADAYVGTYSLLATASGAFDVRSELVPAIAGSILSASAYVKSAQDTTLDIVFFTSSGAEVAGPALGEDSAEILDVGLPATIDGTSDWGRAQVRYLVPDGAQQARIRLVGTTRAAIDAVILERTDRQQFYFDALIADSGGEDAMAVIDGEHAYSVLYSSRLSKLSRLRATLTHYLPLGVSSRVLMWSDSDPFARSFIPYQP